MSRDGTASKKSVASEGREAAAAELLQKYAELMREAGSPNGAWNPDPDEHILGMLRHDVELSPNESKVIAYVKSCCVRSKPKGRTSWGWTETGKPARLTEIKAFFGWDWGNAEKYTRRPLAYGFIRKNADGQFGIGARVQGKFAEEPNPGEAQSEDDQLVCTDKLPKYLVVEIKRLSKADRAKFLNGWRTIRAAAQQRFNAEKKRLYELEQDQLSDHCRAFELELKRKSERPTNEPEAEAENLSVHTSVVQSGDEPLYNAATASVPTAHIRSQSKALFYRGNSSSSEGEHATTTAVSKMAITEGLAQAGPVDSDLVAVFIAECRGRVPDCTQDELLHFIDQKRPLALRRGIQNPVKYLCSAVVNCLDEKSIQSLRDSRPQQAEAAQQPPQPTIEEQIHIEEQWLEAFPDHVSAPETRRHLEQLREQLKQRKPAASQSGEQAQKAGQG